MLICFVSQCMKFFLVKRYIRELYEILENWQFPGIRGKFSQERLKF
jgi:hypothetical protein